MTFPRRTQIKIVVLVAVLAAAAAVFAKVAFAHTQAVGTGVVIVETNLAYEDGSAAGTGMVLTSSGEILTNNHVINGATSISVTDVGNGHTYTA
ncbi:MAG TPA: hypothetical protein VG327_07825, partial [Mycobacterium sp.]|nr:hypothetical protein [Mycobacterium sp.]